MPGTFLNALHVLTHLVFTGNEISTLIYHTHFTDKIIEEGRG